MPVISRFPARALALAFPLLGMLPGIATAQTSAAAASEGIIQKALESRTKGAADAGVVVFEIADFQCPFCANFAQTVGPELDEKYVKTGKVQWVYVNMPLHTHPIAWHAAEAALCAGVAGDRFWEMHDRLFAEQRVWGQASNPGAHFARYAQALGVPADEYRACVDGDQVATLILQDVGSAVSARVDGTPTFIVMKGQEVVQRLVGVHPIEDWSRILDEALQ